MNITAINGSPRKHGNSTQLLKEFIKGASTKDAKIKEINIHTKNISPCRGCLKCNVKKNCVIRDDDWEEISTDILWGDVIVIASPVYFHHLPGPLKIMLDRFRSFIDVKITEEGINHTPWVKWSKQFVLLLPLGSSSPRDGDPIIDLFKYIINLLGPHNHLLTLMAPRLQMTGQIKMEVERLKAFYPKMGLPEHLAENDYKRNCDILKQANALGRELEAP